MTPISQMRREVEDRVHAESGCPEESGRAVLRARREEGWLWMELDPHLSPGPLPSLGRERRGRRITGPHFCKQVTPGGVANCLRFCRGFGFSLITGRLQLPGKTIWVHAESGCPEESGTAALRARREEGWLWMEWDSHLSSGPLPSLGREPRGRRIAGPHFYKQVTPGGVMK